VFKPANVMGQVPACQTDSEYKQAGNDFYFQNKLELARECYLKGLELNPMNAALHYNLAIVYGQFGQYSQAIDEFNQVIMLDPNYLDFASKRNGCLKPWAEQERNHKNYISSIFLYHELLKINGKEYVQIKRDVLAEWGSSLEERVTKVRFNQGDYLTQAFDKEALQLIEAFLIHDKYCAQHTLEIATQHLRTVGNICKTLAYLSKNFRAKYIHEQDGFEYCIWDDLIYLGLSTLEENNLLYEHRIELDSRNLEMILKDLHNFVLPFIQRILSQPDIHRLAAIEKELEQVQRPLSAIDEELNHNEATNSIGLVNKIQKMQKEREDAQNIIKEARKRIQEIELSISKLAKEIEDDKQYLEEEKQNAHLPWYKNSELGLKHKENSFNDQDLQLKGWKLKEESNGKILEAITQEKIDALIQEREQLTKQKNELNQQKQRLLNELGQLKAYNIFEVGAIFAIVNAHREKKALEKIIQYCQVNPNEGYSDESVLRRLFIVGEQLNKQKLTPQTKSKLIKAVESKKVQIDWMLFNLIRNRLAHPENDIYFLTLQKYIKNNKNIMRNILKEDLRNVMKIIEGLLESSEWKNRDIFFYYKCLEKSEKQPDTISSNALKSLRDNMPNEAMHKSESGKQFRHDNQIYLVELVLQEIRSIEQLLQSSKTFNKEALQYALQEDMAELHNTAQSKFVAKKFIKRLQTMLNTQVKEQLNTARDQIIDYHQSLIVSIPRPASAASGHMNIQSISSFVDNENKDFYAKCVIDYGKLCQLYSKLQKSEHILYAIEYHLSLIEEYFKLLEPEYHKDLPLMQKLEAHMHRNAMAHGETYFDLMPQLALHVHYAAWYLHNLKPRFEKFKSDKQRPQNSLLIPLIQSEIYEQFQQDFYANQDLQEMIGGFVNAAQQHFIYSSNAFLQSEQRQVLFCFIAMFHQFNQWTTHNHQQDNPASNALEFDNGIVILPELITTDGEQGIKEQLSKILTCYVHLKKPIYLCINQGGYHFTTLVIAPKDDGTVQYRYIDPMACNKGEWVNLPTDIQRGLVLALQEKFREVNLMDVPHYINQQNKGGEHNNECGFHNIYHTLYMLMAGPNADLSKMRQFFSDRGKPIPGNNTSQNGGIDRTDAEQFLRPRFQQLFYLISIRANSVVNMASNNNTQITSIVSGNTQNLSNYSNVAFVGRHSQSSPSSGTVVSSLPPTSGEPQNNRSGPT
jgi:hypothetical protein